MTHYPNIIKQIFIGCGYKTYLELGVSYGLTLTEMSKVSQYHVGVDIIDIRHNKSTNFHLGTTDSFFDSNGLMFDMIFIDANHDIDFVVKDFENAIKFLNHNGTILLHDTDPENETLLPSHFCSDSYKFREMYADKYEMVTLPSDNCGLTILRNKGVYRFK